MNKTIMLLAIAAVPLLQTPSAWAADNTANNAAGTSDALGTADAWHYSVGFGVANAPLYSGASDTRFKALPLLGATYGRYFFGATDTGAGLPPGLGAYLYRDQHLQAGIALGYDLYSPRKESVDETRLHGLGDIERTYHATLFSRYSNDGLSIYGALVSSGNNQGMQLKLGSELSVKLSPRVQLSAGPSTTWSNASANQTFYGINAQQSANSGLARYSPSAGISDVTFSVGLVYLLSPSWRIGSRVSTSYLPSNINESPVVERPSSVSYSIFSGYRF